MKRVFGFLIGFPIGLGMLVVSYYLLFLANGIDVYNNEIMNLTPKALLNQMAWAGLIYSVLGLFYQETYYYMNKDKKERGKLEVIKPITAFAAFTGLCTAADLVGKFAEEDTVSVLLGTAIVSIVIVTIICIIKTNSNVNKINKELKNRNK